MSEKTEDVKRLIESLSQAELESLSEYLRSKLPKHALEKKWGISYEVILNAINRSQDIVQRGVRGVIAEAVFDANVLPKISGWREVKLKGDLPYDFKIKQESDGREITIQVKLQRTEGGKPLVRKSFGSDNFIVEVQKTRTGTKRKKKSDAVTPDTAPVAPEKTRPYQFGDFGIIAVNMQPSTNDWNRFMYTVGDWLIPRGKEKNLIEVFQPVHSSRTDKWTDKIEECIEWFLSGRKTVIFNVEAAKAKKLAERDARRAQRKKREKGLFD